MVPLHILGLLLLVHSSVAANTVVVPNYNDASDKIKGLVDALLDNYNTFSMLQLVKNIPKLEDQEKCNQQKTQYAENLQVLLQETDIKLATSETSSTKENTIEVDTNQGKMTLPYIEKKEGGSITCQKLVTTDAMQTALRTQLTELAGKLPMEQLNDLKAKLIQHPQYEQVAAGAKAVKDNIRTRQEQLSTLVQSYWSKYGTSKTQETATPATK